MLTETHKGIILDAARRAIVRQVTGDPLPDGLACDLPQASGVFVTVKSGGVLRGCLGTLECRKGLLQEVIRCAADAASVDPRFRAISASELPDLAIEVSVLGPLEEIDPNDPLTIVPGRHGLVVEQGKRRGLLLPQVATEWEWTREQFLQHTCRKAGLEPDAWRRGARVLRFDAEVFGG
jgi:AmmeMemoRadiSam system protein A